MSVINTNNMIVRQAMVKCGFKQYEVAEIVGYSEYYFSRLMRKELPENEQMTIVSKIEEAYAEKIQCQKDYNNDLIIINDLMVSDKLTNAQKAALQRILSKG